MSTPLPPELSAGLAAEIVGTEPKSEQLQMAEADVAIERMEKGEVTERVGEIKGQLVAYAQSQGLRSLEDRIKRGLFTIGMLAVPEVRTLVEELAEKMGAMMKAQVEEGQAPASEGVEDIVLHNQMSGPWKYAEYMTAEDPSAEIKVWMMMNAINHIDIPQEKDLNPKEFLKHVEHLKILFAEALRDPETFWQRARQENLEKTSEKLRYVDGIPVSELDQGYIPAAIQGYEAGITQDADGTTFVGAKKPIPSAIFERWGLVRKEEDDSRGRKNVPTYYNNQGHKLFRQLYSGFLVIDAKTLELPAAIVRAIDLLDDGVAVEDLEIPPESTLGVTMYVPTSSEGKENRDGWTRMGYMRRHLEEHIPGEPEPGQTTALLSLRESLYEGMHWIKAHVIALDVLDDAEDRKQKKGQGSLTEAEKAGLFRKVESKMKQKMDELRYLMDVIGREIENLPADVSYSIDDMAGGAGDLGLAVATYMLAKGKNLEETRIIDPFSKYASLDHFTDFMLDHLPFQKELRGNVVHTNESIQQAEIEKNSIVVAKHPCGDLADLIIEKWVQSESPMLVIMTCCQDKACGCPSRYGIAQSDWNTWCRESSRTNVELPPESDKSYPKMKTKLESGKEAMFRLDNARVEYLRRHGFEADLVTNDNFHKGDIIVARRKPETGKGPLKIKEPWPTV